MQVCACANESAFDLTKRLVKANAVVSAIKSAGGQAIAVPGV